MKKFKIFQFAGLIDRPVAVIEADTEHNALRNYRKCLISSGEKELIKMCNHWHLVTSYGAEFVAEEIR